MELACNIYQVFCKLCAGVNLEYLLIILVPNKLYKLGSIFQN